MANGLVDKIEAMRLDLEGANAMNKEESESIAQGYEDVSERRDNIAEARLRLKYEATQVEALRTFDERTFDYRNLRSNRHLPTTGGKVSQEEMLERIQAFK